MARTTVTMKDLAKAADVSVMTVSRAFRADKSINKKTQDRILKIADELGYVLDTTAANLRTQKSGFVAVTIPSINNGNFADTVDALSSHLEAAGMQVLLGYTGYDIVREEVLIAQLLRRRPEAIVVTGGQHSDRTRRMLSQSGIPVVETWDLPKDPIDHVVGFSNADAARGMVAHLVAGGLQRIAFLGGAGDGDPRGADRRRGFLEAMAQNGLETTRLISSGTTSVSMREGAVDMGHLLDTLPDTQAVICASDLGAFGALTECQRRGVRVPKDIAIAGFGAYDIATECHPTLTTIDPQPRLIGTTTATLILDILDGNTNVGQDSQIIKIKWKLQPAGTT